MLRGFRHIIGALIFCHSIVANAKPIETPTQDNLSQLVEWELLHNPGISPEDIERLAESIRSRLTKRPGPVSARNRGASAEEIVTRPFYPDCYEIPLESLHLLDFPLIRTDWSMLPPGVREMLTFQKNGRTYVRWLLHPTNGDENGGGIHQMVRRLRSWGHQINGPRRVPFQAHLSASRSLLLATPNDDVFSVKVSMPTAAGRFRDKTIHFSELEAWASHHQFLVGTVSPEVPGGLPILPEPVIFGGRVDVSSYAEDGFVVRNLQFNAHQGPHPLPAFALFDNQVLQDFQRRHGESDPVSFFEQHVILPLAHTQATIRTYGGAEHTSPHSQNILLMVGDDGLLSDQVRMRDLDYYVDHEAWGAWKKEYPSMPQATEANLTKEASELLHRFSLLNGIHPNRLPSWVDAPAMRQFVTRYFESFRTESSRITHIPPFRDANISRGGVRTKFDRASDFDPHLNQSTNVYMDERVNPSLIGPRRLAWINSTIDRCRTSLARVTSILTRPAH